MQKSLDSLVEGKLVCHVVGLDNDIRKESLRGIIYFPGVLFQCSRLFNCIKCKTVHLLVPQLPKMLMFAKGKFGISFHSFSKDEKKLMWRCIDLLKGQQQFHRSWFHV